MSSDELHESAKGEAASSGTEAAPGGPSIVVLGDRDHVEKRPAIYLGPGAVTSVTAPVVGRGGRLEFREVQKVPRLHNAAKEIFVNASDQVFRESGAGENKTKAIRINLNKETGEIVVRNNGSGIPIRQMDVKTGADHPSTVMWEPTVVFSVWRSSSNYDDTKDRTTAGQNGLGAKLTNTVSKKFDVETVDDTTKRRFRQSWSRNMKETTGPVVEENVTAEPYTQVAFVLDFHNYDTESADAEQLDADQLEEDRLGLLKMLAYETALVVAGKCQVYLNDELLPISDLKSFVDLFEQPKLDTPGLKYPRPVCYEVLSQDWEIAALAGDGASFKQQSFVNAINTVDGGTHVDYIKKQVVDALAKKLKITTFAEKKILTNQLWLFVKYRRDKPEFGTQVKDQLTKPSVKQIAREQAVCIPDSFINSILKSGVAEMFRAAAKERQHNKMDQQFKSTKGHKRILGLPKLEDANHAGHGEKSQGCTLILTEGDSAKALAVAGLGVVGRDKYGVFPLRGKVLNVRDCSDALFHGNKEIQAICRIVGLQPHVPNPKKKDLRYQRIMIMTDQDLDGSHIKGLLVNLFFSKWPSLVKDNDFLCQFITPIVKVQKGKEERMFYSLAVYDEWRKENNNGKGWSIKYYKGLGTSTAAEAKSYFRKMDENKITFEYDDEADETIDLAFSAKRADDRKRWMAGTQATDVVDYRNKTLTYTDFANKDYVHYCKYSAERAIPSVVDGLKPTQRKILYGAFKKKMNKDLKVAQMVGYVSENGCYHHGETSLEGAIVAMAQSYVGSNNINLLVPSGQFGTRHLKGKDAASGRYLYTRLSPVTRKIFPEADDDVLEYKEDDGQTIEPTFFVPLIPMVLVNGASGIGTGYSTDVPSHSPIAIIDNIKQQLRGGRPRALKPHYERFLGEVTPIDKNGTFVIQGKIMKTSPTVLEIVDIPVGNGSDSTRTYKEMLERFVDPPKVVKDAKTGKSKAIEAPPEPVISDYREYHTEDTLHFKLKLTEEQMQRAEASGLQGLFKLNQTQSTANMMLHDAENVIRRYPSANEIIRDHMIVRLQLYEKRKKHLIAKLTEEKVILGERLRFTELMVDPDFRVLMVQGEAEIHAALAQHNFKPIRELRQLVASSIAEDKEVDLVAQQDFPGSQKYTRDDFRYLTSADIYGYTMEEVNRLREQSQAKAALLEEIKKKSVEQMWDDELSELREMLMDEKLENAEAVIDNAEEEGPDKSKTKKPKMAAKGKGKPDAPLQVETGADNISTKPQKSSAELVREKLQHEIEYFSQQEVNKEVPVTKIVLDDLIVQQNDDKKKQPGHRPSSKKRPQAGKNIKKNAKEMIPAAGAKKNEKLLPDSDEEEPEQKRRRVIGTGQWALSVNRNSQPNMSLRRSRISWPSRWRSSTLNPISATKLEPRDPRSSCRRLRCRFYCRTRPRTTSTRN
ncbi:unnamed protein product [Amoebophrya sp. A120]|nr:unnamed protein product [Amoebophrya sp. A120]|eukprot:GSA120T00025366001.1